MPGPYREDFIRYCAAHRVPLDFLSWHHYHGASDDPYDMPRIGQVTRQLLDASGFREAEIDVTEWNVGQGAGRSPRQLANLSPIASAAFVGAALIYLQDSVLQHATYYRADAGPRRLFETDGGYTKNTYVFQATGGMLDTPERLAVTGADTLGFAVLAGRSADGGNVRILIANYEIPPVYRSPRPGQRRLPRQTGIAYSNNRGYALKIANLPWGDAAFSIKRYRLSDTDNFTLQTLPLAHGPALALSHDLTPPAVELIVLERQ